MTFYLHPEYLASELRWLPREHPMVHQLQRSLSGDTTLGLLHLPPDALHSLVPRLARVAQLDANLGNEFAMLSAASEVIDMVGRASGTRTASSPGHAHRQMPRREVALAVALLRECPDRPWRVDDLARRVAMSASQLSRVFRSQVGMAPATYLRQVRVDKMAELLVTQRLGVREAAQRAGWNNPTVASRVFRQRYGVSPRTFASTCADLPSGINHADLAWSAPDELE